jgi:UDP-3-O-[3-hydroxymyristoyl] glucosamine N-acyltransferase
VKTENIMKLKEVLTLKQIALIIDVKLSGSSDSFVKGINEIHMVEEGDITFVDHPKYYDKALNSAASFVIINKDLKPPAGKSLLISKDPFKDYVKLVKHFRPFEHANKMVSDTALIGENTVIQPGVFIGNHVVIGKNVLLHSGVVIYDRCVVGDNVIIHANSVIGGDAFYFKKYPDDGYQKMESCGRVLIEDHVEIGASCTIDKGVSGDTIIGRGTKFDNQVHIGHDTVIGKNCLFAAQVGVGGVVRVEDDVILWGQVGVHKDLTIGKGAVVLGQSGIGKSLKSNTTYFGSPVVEARDKMKELAMIKMMPRLIEELKQR